MSSGEVAILEGRSAAEIATDLLASPLLKSAAIVLQEVVKLCQNVQRNRRAALQLAQRCGVLLLAIQDLGERNHPSEFTDIVVSVESVLRIIWTRLSECTNLKWFEHFSKQSDIARNIRQCHVEITTCCDQFQIKSHILMHEWHAEFERNQSRDNDAMIAYLADISNQGKLTHEIAKLSAEGINEIFQLMRKYMSENLIGSDIWRPSLAQNLHGLLQVTGSLLPDRELKKGEVIIGGEARGIKTGQAVQYMDYFFGKYLDKEPIIARKLRHITATEDVVKRFEREAKVWGKVWMEDKGKYTVPVYGFYREDEGDIDGSDDLLSIKMYLVSPHYANGTAIEYLAQYPEKDHISLLRDIAKGLRALHEMDVMHGDMRGTSVMIDDRGNPLITDFGLSKILLDVGATSVPLSRSTESTRWVPPEVLHAEPRQSKKSDVFMYGRTVLELLTHQDPFYDVKSENRVVQLVTEGILPSRPTDEETIKRGLTDKLWEFLKDCWREDPRERPNMSQIIKFMMYM